MFKERMNAKVEFVFDVFREGEAFEFDKAKVKSVVERFGFEDFEIRPTNTGFEIVVKKTVSVGGISPAPIYSEIMKVNSIKAELVREVSSLIKKKEESIVEEKPKKRRGGRRKKKEEEVGDVG